MLGFLEYCTFPCRTYYITVIGIRDRQTYELFVNFTAPFANIEFTSINIIIYNILLLGIIIYGTAGKGDVH